MRRLSVYVRHLATALATLTLSVHAFAADRPNVIVILTDDQGWGDLSLHDNPNLSTPNIDAMARDGAEVTNFYVCAVCSPTRAEFLTGRYHTRMGVHSTSTGGERFQRRRTHDRRTLPRGGICHRRLREMAQRHAVSLPPPTPAASTTITAFAAGIGETISRRCWSTTAAS